MNIVKWILSRKYRQDWGQKKLDRIASRIHEIQRHIEDIRREITQVTKDEKEGLMSPSLANWYHDQNSGAIALNKESLKVLRRRLRFQLWLNRVLG